MIDKRPPKFKMRAVLLFGLGLLATMACTCVSPTGFLPAPVEEGSLETAVAQTIEAGQAVEQQVQQTVAAALAAQEAVAEAPAGNDLADPNTATPISQPAVESNVAEPPTLAATWTPTNVPATQVPRTPTNVPAQDPATATPHTPTHTPTSTPTNTPEPTQLSKSHWQVDFLYLGGGRRLQPFFNQNGGVLSGSNRDNAAEVNIVTTGMVTGNTVTITFTLSNGADPRGSVTCTGTIDAGPPQRISGSFTTPTNETFFGPDGNGSCAFS